VNTRKHKNAVLSKIAPGSFKALTLKNMKMGWGLFGWSLGNKGGSSKTFQSNSV